MRRELRHAFLALSLLAPHAVAQAPAQKLADDLDQASKLLRSNGEETVREGARLCRKLNVKKAMELLLDVLKDSQPHHRDIVWEELPGFTDPESRKLVEHELRTNAKSEGVREWCAQLLGLYGDTAFGPSLEHALGDPDLGVKRAATVALGLLRYEPAAKELETLAKDKDPILRADAIEALARIKPDTYQQLFLQALSDEDGGVRCALLGALPALYNDLAIERSAAAIKDPDWRPRMQAIDNLAAIPMPETIDILIKFTRDRRPVVAERANDKLRTITGLRWTIAEQWEGWWGKNKEDVAAGKKPNVDPDSGTRAPDPAKFVSYFGLRVISDHVAFLIDKSADMDKMLKGEMRRKIDVAVDELEKTLAKLPNDVEFNVFNYSTEVSAFSRKSVKLDDRQRKAAVSFVKNEPNDHQKDIWNALKTVMEDPELDTIYLLSSGEPEVGEYVHYNRVTLYLRDLNRFHKVVVHGVAYHENQWYRDQIQKITEATGGEFVGKD
jgi:HEAT repeat protein